MVLQNQIILQDGIPAKIHIYDHTIEKRTITDPLTGNPKVVNTLVLYVDRLNDSVVDARYSTISEKHAQQFSAYLPEKTYRDYDFVITQTGEGFRRGWSVQSIPH